MNEIVLIFLAFIMMFLSVLLMFSLFVVGGWLEQTFDTIGTLLTIAYIAFLATIIPTLWYFFFQWVKGL